jgi:spore coat protein CotH
LKGDLLDHLKDKNSWSFRVKVKGDNTIDGMKVFSLHNPKARNYINEWLYLKLLEKEGLIALRYKFVTITLNGKNLGVYAMEEHFNKRLIENNKLREGPIIKFSEDLHWQERVAHRGRPMDEAYIHSRIDGFQTKKTNKNKVLKQQCFQAATLLEKFRRHELKTSQVFNVDKLAKYIAISLVMGAKHGLVWHNERFYYNPITSKLEPIGFDGEAGGTINRSFFPTNLYERTLFADPIFQEKLIEQLRQVSEKSYLDTFFVSIKDELEENLNIIYKGGYHLGLICLKNSL